MTLRPWFSTLCLLALLIMTTVAPAVAAIPGLINFQAELTDASGEPLDGTYRMRFFLYDDADIGVLLWSSGERNVTATDGILDVLLGETTVFTGDEFSGNRPAFLQIDVRHPDTGTWEELGPRQQLTAVPFALEAGNAETLNGLDETDFSESVHDHRFDELTGMVADAQIPDTITVLRANNATSADTLDGMPPTAFAPSTHEHDADYVDEGQTNSVTTSMIIDGDVQESDIRNNAVTAAKISPNFVSSVDGVTNKGGNIDLVEGHNVTITSDDEANSITISAAGGGVSDHGGLTGLADNDHPQYVQRTGDTINGVLTVNGGMYTNGNIEVGTHSTTNNDYIIMDGGSGLEYEHFAWIDSSDTFSITNDLSLHGVLQTGGVLSNPGYNRFGDGTPSSTYMSDAQDVLVSDDLEVGDNLIVHGALSVGTYVGTDDDYIFMHNGLEALSWDLSEERFQFSDSLFVTGELKADENVQAGGDFKYSETKTFYHQIPGIAFHLDARNYDYLKYGTAIRYFSDLDVYAPVQLPQGAVIQSITIFYYDNDSATFFSSIKAYFYRRGIYDVALDMDDEMDTLGYVEFPGAITDSESMQELIIDDFTSPAVIDNSINQYVVRVYLNPFSNTESLDIRFYGVRIEYELQVLKP